MQYLAPCRPISWKKWTRIGARRIIFQSGRSICRTILCSNPPLKLEHIKPRLLGHWGTTPGLNFLYVHLNRLIKENDLNMIYVIGPGHGGPGIVANDLSRGLLHRDAIRISSRTAMGMQRLFRQFSWPYGIPSHVAPETPGSIHEGGELGYSLAHAYGAAFDNPDLIVACVVGDGEAETGALATSWHSNKFLNPGARRRGAADPPSERLQDRQSDRARAHQPHEELTDLIRGYGYEPHFVEGDDPEAWCIKRWPPRLIRCLTKITQIQKRRALGSGRGRAAALADDHVRTPKGWTGPKFVDGKPVEGTWRAHQVPFSELRKSPSICACSKTG